MFTEAFLILLDASSQQNSSFVAKCNYLSVAQFMPFPTSQFQRFAMTVGRECNFSCPVRAVGTGARSLFIYVGISMQARCQLQWRPTFLPSNFYFLRARRGSGRPGGRTTQRITKVARNARRPTFARLRHLQEVPSAVGLRSRRLLPSACSAARRPRLMCVGGGRCDPGLSRSIITSYRYQHTSSTS